MVGNGKDKRWSGLEEVRGRRDGEFRFWRGGKGWFLFVEGGKEALCHAWLSACRERRSGTSLLTQKRGLTSMFRDLRREEKRGLFYMASRFVVFFALAFIR